MKTKNFSKKGDTTLLKELIYLVVGITALIVIFTKAPVIMGLFYDTPDKVSVNNFERLVTEIKAILIEYSENENLELRRSIPLNFNEEIGVKFYNGQDEKPTKCRKRDLPCVCIAYFEKFSVNEEVYKCQSIDKNTDFLFDYYQGNSGQGNLIRGQGIGSFELSFLIDDYGRLNLKINSNFEVVENLYVPFSEVCNEQCDYRAWGTETSETPKGSPFGKILPAQDADNPSQPNTVMTAGYKAKSYFELIEQETGFEIPKGQEWRLIHTAIDIVPDYTYYDRTVSDNLTNFRVGRPIQEKVVFYSTCDGVVQSIGQSSSEAFYVIINCNDQIHSIDMRHNAVHFVQSGDVVEYGQPIGIMGDTGKFTTAAHVHYVIKKNGVPVNPLFYVDKSYFKSYPNSQDAFLVEVRHQLDKCYKSNAKDNKDLCVIESYKEIDSNYQVPFILANNLDVDNIENHIAVISENEDEAT